MRHPSTVYRPFSDRENSTAPVAANVSIMLISIDVEPLRRPGEPTPPLVHDEPHPGEIGEAGEGPQLGRVRQEVDEDGVQFDPGDVARPERVGGEQVAAAADADDGHGARRPRGVGQLVMSYFKERRSGCRGGLPSSSVAIGSICGRRRLGPRQGWCAANGGVTVIPENEFQYSKS